jgi:deoxyhypusine synthase
MSASGRNGKGGKSPIKIHKGHGFRSPTIPFEPKKGRGVAGTLEALKDISFQGRSLGIAFSVWQKALQDNTTIWLGLAGAMVPAGLRKTLVHMVEKRYVDVITTTGANMFHDLHQAMGGIYYKCSPATNDIALRKARLDRMYDVAASDLEMVQVDAFIAKFAVETFGDRPITTREFFWRLGKHLDGLGAENCVLSAAYRAGVPIYCPAIGDAGFGIALATHGPEARKVKFDVVGDVYETGRISLDSGTTGVVFVGGGTPKNFTQQTWVTGEYLADQDLGGHKYCVQLTQDAPHWGGLSGCTFEESTSWGKIDFDAKVVQVYVDATIGLPILVQGLADIEAEKLRKSKPIFEQGPTLRMTPAGSKKERVLA